MAIDRRIFFDRVRSSLFGGSLKQSQVDAMNAILGEWERRGYTDPGHIAYTLATAKYEPGADMVPVREAYGSNDADTIRRLDAAWAAGRLPWVSKPYWRRDAQGKAWYGRGLCQLTHRDNYQRMGQRIGVDLVGNPDLALQLDTAAKIIVVGMAEGMFTGKKLADYIGSGKRDYVGARRIVNPDDKGPQIAADAVKFEAALRAAERLAEPPSPPPVPTPPPPDIEPPAPTPGPHEPAPPSKKGVGWVVALLVTAAAAAGAAAALYLGG